MCLRTISEQTYLSEDQTVNYMSLGLLTSLNKAFDSFISVLSNGSDQKLERLAMEALCVVANLKQSRVEAWRVVVSHGIIDQLVKLFQCCPSLSVRFEIMYALLALSDQADYQSINYQPILPMVVACLQVNHPEDELHRVCLNLLTSLHKKAAKARDLQTLGGLFELIGGLDTLEALQYSPSNMVYKQAVRIIEKFYGLANNNSAFENLI